MKVILQRKYILNILIYFHFVVWCQCYNIVVGILPKRKDGSETILTKLQSVIDGFDSKSNDKGIVILLSCNNYYINIVFYYNN